MIHRRRGIETVNGEAGFLAYLSASTRALACAEPLLYHFEGDSIYCAIQTQRKLTQVALRVARQLQQWSWGQRSIFPSGIRCQVCGATTTALQNPAQLGLTPQNLAYPNKNIATSNKTYL